jgi:hypothetical protein
MTLYKIIIRGMMAAALAASVPAFAAPGDGEGGYRPGTIGEEFRHYKDRMADMVAKGTIVIGRMADRMGTMIDAEIDGFRRGGKEQARPKAADIAADLCADAVERKTENGQVDAIRSVDPDGDGWRVEGVISTVSGGGERPFVCGVRGGKVDYVELGEADDLG